MNEGEEVEITTRLQEATDLKGEGGSGRGPNWVKSSTASYSCFHINDLDILCDWLGILKSPRHVIDTHRQTRIMLKQTHKK